MMLIVESCLYIVQYAQLFKETDILECSGDSILADIYRFLSRDILSVQKNFSAVRFIHTCQQVKNRGLACAVRSDQTVQFFFFYRYVKCIHRAETAK